MSDDLGAYMAFFRGQVEARHLAFGEFTPAYCLLRDDGLQALRAQHDSVRLIFLMRDPVDRLWSALRMRQRDHEGFDAVADFEAGLDDAILVEKGRYDLTLETIDRVFPERDLWTGFYETIFTPARVGALCSWIGVGYQPPDTDRHPNRAPRLEMEPRHRRNARERLDPVYRYCRARFGRGLPAEWMD